MTTNARQPHAALDANSRVLKARKIEKLLGLESGNNPLTLLEVGCGSGAISHYFGMHPSDRFAVQAVDVSDSRIVFEGYTFQAIADTHLPYADAQFDVVISNHVIEHVGDKAVQMHHLQELQRVLKPGGVGYLAVPNRWMLIEPHYSLAFLSWLPVSMRSPYLALFRSQKIYDCSPLEMYELECMLQKAEFDFENKGLEALRAMLDIEGGRSLPGNIAAWLPDWFIRALKPVIPTLIYTLKKKV